jgi:hypothetical protein
LVERPLNVAHYNRIARKEALYAQQGLGQFCQRSEKIEPSAVEKTSAMVELTYHIEWDLGHAT